MKKPSKMVIERNKKKRQKAGSVNFNFYRRISECMSCCLSIMSCVFCFERYLILFCQIILNKYRKRDRDIDGLEEGN